MKRILFKFTITLGLLLFFTLLIPHITPSGVIKASASSIDKEKSDFRLNVRSTSLVRGKSFSLKVYNLNDNSRVSYRSNDQEIASVNEDGIVSANKVGTTAITVTIREGAITTSLTCDITVGPPAISVKLSKSRIILGLDRIDLLSVILKPSNTTEVARFSSFDSSIASVSTGGRVTARKLGLSYLFAEIGESSEGTRKFAVCTVIIVKPDEVTLLESYFNERPELNLISEQDFSKALEEFFNSELASKTSLIEAFDKFLNEKFDMKALRNLARGNSFITNTNTIEVVTENKLR